MIQLHNLPPSVIEQPSTSLSVLQNHLLNNNIKCDIKYWNIIFEPLISEIVKLNNKGPKENEELLCLLPFLLKANRDKIVDSNIYHFLMSITPEKLIENKYYFSEFFEKKIQQLDNLFHKEFNNFQDNDIMLHGFTARFNQWIPAKAIAKNLKLRDKKTKIVIGGFDSKEEAEAIFSLSDDFDFAVWGEGENTLQLLYKAVKRDGNGYESIPHLLYREEKNIISSPCDFFDKFVNLNEITPDYDSYFNCIKEHNCDKNKVFIPIENGRGCNWNKCKFCYLNNSYNRRQKSYERIIEEIRYYSEKFNVYSFVFTGTDLLGFKVNEFSSFLDKLIVLTEDENEEFTFVGEVIPKNIPETLIKKLSMLNFVIQIGYESTSDLLLQKMGKATNFADLLHFIKMALKYGLKLKGINIIRYILNEQKEDIFDAINNLPFLRFFLGENGFKHVLSELHVKHGSEFFSELLEMEKTYWDKSKLYDLISSCISIDDSKRFFISSFSSRNKKHVELWNSFSRQDKFFTENRFSYRILKEQSKYYYKEYLNGSLIKSIVFDDPIFIDILRCCQSSIASLDSLILQLKDKYKNINKNIIQEYLCQLKEEFLLYFNKDIPKSIISLIDVEIE